MFYRPNAYHPPHLPAPISVQVRLIRVIVNEAITVGPEPFSSDQRDHTGNLFVIQTSATFPPGQLASHGKLVPPLVLAELASTEVGIPLLCWPDV